MEPKRGPAAMAGEDEMSHGTACARALARMLMVASLTVFVAACAQTTAFVSERELPETPGPRRVLLMPPDIEVAEVTAGGLHEPNAAWTARAKVNVAEALDAILRQRNARLVPYRSASGEARVDEPHLQVVKLHRAVGGTIRVHKYRPEMALPTKKDRFDWSLGEGATALGESFDADYALFVYFRDSFASEGRVAVMFVAAVLFRVGLPGGRQVGFASLVDLDSGELVWFNRLVSETGDIREPELARSAAEKLLSELPL